MTPLIKCIFVLYSVVFCIRGFCTPHVPAADVLIVHDSLPGPQPSGLVAGNTILDLLGHFGLRGDLIALEDYQSRNLGKFRFVIILGVGNRQTAYPKALLHDLRNANQPVLWIAAHINELLDDPTIVGKLGFSLGASDLLSGYQSIAYKGQCLLKGEPSLFPIQILDLEKVQVLASAKHSDGTLKPYAIRSGSFWYFADSPFAYAIEGDRYLVFCDLLHDFFNIPHGEAHKALLRIEDVSAESNPERLRAVADYLYRKQIPFQVGLIPIFKVSEQSKTIHLSDRPHLVSALHYMAARGGMIVMHGSTHQYRGESGLDYEFWDERNGQRIQGDSSTVVGHKLHAGLEELFKNGIYPVTWETPHYAASQVDYQAFARFFSSAYERICSLDYPATGHYFPYSTVDRFGRFIIPENLGFLSANKPDPALLVANAAKLLAVRDGVASFFFHPFLELDYLKKVVEGIEALGYQFESIGEYDLRVQLGERLVQTRTRVMRIPLASPYFHRFLVHRDGHISGESFSKRPPSGLLVDQGVVPDGTMLILEGVSQAGQPKNRSVE